MWLVHNNVPWDVAFSLDDLTRRAYAIQFRRMHGAKFNLNTMQFEETN